MPHLFFVGHNRIAKTHVYQTNPLYDSFMIMPDAIRALEDISGDLRTSLPEDLFLFASRITPLVNVDLLTQDHDHRTLLAWRSDSHYGAGWHIPGVIRYQETVHHFRSTSTRRSRSSASCSSDLI